MEDTSHGGDTQHMGGHTAHTWDTQHNGGDIKRRGGRLTAHGSEA